jgi:hypothetical protein
VTKSDEIREDSIVNQGQEIRSYASERERTATALPARCPSESGYDCSDVPSDEKALTMTPAWRSGFSLKKPSPTSNSGPGTATR